VDRPSRATVGSRNNISSSSSSSQMIPNGHPNLPSERRIVLEEDADQWARRLQYATDLLLNRLMSYLSQLPEVCPTTTSTMEDTTTDRNLPGPTNSTSSSRKGGGLTLPLTALAWLSSQYYPNNTSRRRDYPHGNDDDDNNNDIQRPYVCPTLWSTKSIKDRLRKLQPLLSRITHLRITSRLEWPPPLPTPPKPSTSSSLLLSSLPFRVLFQPSTSRTSTTTTMTTTTPPPREVNVGIYSSLDDDDVASVLTIEDIATTPTAASAASSSAATTSRKAFREYIQTLNEKPICDARLFPNLQVLVMETVDPIHVRTRLNSSTTSTTAGTTTNVPTPATTTTTTTMPMIIENMFPHFYDQWHSTLELLKWNQSNLSLSLETLFLPSENFSSTRTIHEDDREQQQDQPQQQKEEKGEDSMISLLSSPSPSSVSSNPFEEDNRYSQLTHLDLSHSNLGPASGLVEILSLFPNLKALNLSYNRLGLDDDIRNHDDNNNNDTSLRVVDLFNEKRNHYDDDRNDSNVVVDDDDDFFLSGLKCAAYLQTLNLSHNGISSGMWLSRAHLYLGGQLIKLDLSYNQLDTVMGIDQLHSLQELRLNHNQLTYISDLAGLCRLSNLKSLFLHDNPPLEELHPLYLKQIWAWCLDDRQAMKPSELPLLNGMTITIPQWNALVMEMVPTRLTTKTTKTSPFLNTPRKVQRVLKRTRQRAKIERYSDVDHDVDEASLVRDRSNLGSRLTKVPPKRNMVRTRATKTTVSEILPPLSFSIQDVLVSLHGQPEEDDGSIVSILNGNPRTIDETTEPSPRSRSPFFFVDTDVVEEALDGVWDIHDQILPLEPIDDFITNTQVMTEETADEGPESTDVDGELFDQTSRTAPADDSATRHTAVSSQTPLKSNGTLNSAPRETKGRLFNVMTADWDELIDRVAGGMIPDGKPRMPLSGLSVAMADAMAEAPFSEDAADLLPSGSVTDRPTLKDWEGGSVVASSKGWRSTLPDQIYPDDLSVPSSLGTNREDFPIRQNRFQIAEENTTYDGPTSWATRNVIENLRDYFELYVFPSSFQLQPQKTKEMGDEDDNDDDHWENVALIYPRIQLFPDDRRIMEMSTQSNPSLARSPASEIDSWSLSKQETFVRVWEEDIVPCGRASIRRLLPYRRPRLSFHGDQLYTAGDLDPYAECRKVYLCLSTVALYVILKDDDVVKMTDGKGPKKKFPNPISEQSSFSDAPWPHAVARHSFHDLQAVTIGFEFQRLTLHFANPFSRKADPFVYVLLTCNKKSTITLLQEIQKLAKEAKPESLQLNVNDATSIAIENDSQDVMDALQAGVSPEVVGTILHYQILHQRWKHGEERGIVRRVCVVTDTKLFLMDEDYHADSHKPSNLSTTGDGMLLRTTKTRGLDLAKVSYRLVDDAFLNQVAEVQAAGADPKAITIFIRPQGRLSRTHRWRLICRDSVGAERLVEDVRKAISILE